MTIQVFFIMSKLGKGFRMTSLKKRLDNVLTELTIIRQGLDRSGRYPSCCLTVHNDGTIRCDVIGPLAEKRFLKECEKCQAQIKNLLIRINLDEVQS